MHNRRPVIGLTSSYERNGDMERIFLPHNYLDSLRHFGAIPLLIPVKAEDVELAFLLNRCDGLLLTGGNDINPAVYGEQRWNDTVEPAPERDEMERKLCAMAAERQLPILGICRGMQLMNVCFGGTLYQDIPTQLDTAVKHRMDPPDRRTCHNCVLEENSPLYAAIGEKVIPVNSHHHQAVKDLAPGFRVAGCCEDGVIEAIWDPNDRFRVGVQWHPEKIWDIEPSSARIFEAFVEACKK